MTISSKSLNSHPLWTSSVLAFGFIAAGLLGGCGGGSSSGGGGGGNTNTIVFVSNRDGNNEIYRMRSDGSSQTRLTNNAGTDSAPNINRAGTEVVFVSNRDGNNEIYKLTLATNQLQRFTSDEVDVSDSSPVFSPDGSRIAWISERDGANNIWVMDATGANQTKVTTTGAGDVTWNPNGTEVAYFRGRNIIIRNVSSGVESTITPINNTGTVFRLRWSPDGNKFLFTRLIPSAGITSTLVSLDITTGEETGVAPENTSQTYYGSWSPNSNSVVWQALRANQNDEIGQSQIYTGPVPRGNSTPTRLTTQGANTETSWAP